MGAARLTVTVNAIHARAGKKILSIMGSPFDVAVGQRSQFATHCILGLAARATTYLSVGDVQRGGSHNQTSAEQAANAQQNTAQSVGLQRGIEVMG
jgi:hypothetical protein